MCAPSCSPSLENERRFAAARRVSEINLGLYRTLFQPFVKASVNEQSVEWMKKLNHAELPFEIFSDRNPLMQQVAQLAEQVRAAAPARIARQPVPAPGRPWFRTRSSRRSNGYRDLRERSSEKLFLAIYSSPVLQAMLGLNATDESPRRHPGLEPERTAFIQQRIAELKAGIAKGGAREAAIRALVYIGMGGEGVDERAFNELRQIRAENHGVTLQAFKQILREQYFSLVLDREGALAAIPAMLPDDAASRAQVLEAIRRILNAVGPVTGERAQRLAQIEQLFGAGLPAASASQPAPRKVARKTARKAG